MTFIRRLTSSSPAIEPEQQQQVVDTRSPFERVRDYYDQLHSHYSDKLVIYQRNMEKLRTDIAECEAIIRSVEDARTSLNAQVLEKGLLGNDDLSNSLKITGE